MVIDTSALIALLLSEPETADFVSAIGAASSRLLSAPSYVETAIVMVARSGSQGQEKLDQLIGVLAIEVFPFTREQADLAVAAYRRFGKGSGHPAGLNFGDCFSYALARLRSEPLLFKGSGFLRTDLEIAPASDRTAPN
ncbi:MAG TPA: type II toxin-antitoxin system VapC family toxin [Stellaceae bacterium]|nr:type II toxin-antitoxin system VapC family toxin [Stellaceae bacterium]